MKRHKEDISMIQIDILNERRIVMRARVNEPPLNCIAFISENPNDIYTYNYIGWLHGWLNNNKNEKNYYIIVR